MPAGRKRDVEREGFARVEVDGLAQRAIRTERVLLDADLELGVARRQGPERKPRLAGGAGAGLRGALQAASVRTA